MVTTLLAYSNHPFSSNGTWDMPFHTRSGVISCRGDGGTKRLGVLACVVLLHVMRRPIPVFLVLFCLFDLPFLLAFQTT